jgi:hypothetical protein
MSRVSKDVFEVANKCQVSTKEKDLRVASLLGTGSIETYQSVQVFEPGDSVVGQIQLLE